MRRLGGNALRAFARDTRASAGIELAIGAVVLLGVATCCFDLYTRVESDTAVGRVAATMADYVSRGPDTDGGTLDGAALKKLGDFLHEHELGGATDLVLVVSGINYPEDRPGYEVLWSDDTLRFGNEAVTKTLAAGCTRIESRRPPITDPSSSLDEADVIVEICARRAGSLFGGDIYRLHVLPARAPEKGLPAPVHARRGGAGDTEARA